MEAWKKWMNDNKASIVEGGAPLGKTKRVNSTASDTKNEVGGYSVVQAEWQVGGHEKAIRQRPSISANARRMDRNRRDHADA